MSTTYQSKLSSWRQPPCVLGWSECPETIHTKLLAKGAVGVGLALHEDVPVVAQVTAQPTGSTIHFLDVLDEEGDGEPLSKEEFPWPTRHISWGKEVLLAASHGSVKQFATNVGRDGVECELQKTYEIAVTEKEPMPDDWLPSRVVCATAIRPLQHTEFAAIAGKRLYCFDYSKEVELNTTKVSGAPCLCLDYSTLAGHHLAVSGFSRTIKVLDANEPDHVIWKRTNAHGGAVRDVRFSPLVPHWLASVGDDGCLRLWDTRFGTDAVLCVNTYQTMTLKAAWAHTHTELLAVGGADGSVKLLSLRSAPQHIVACDRQSLSSQVVGLCATVDRAEQAFTALSSAGELLALRVTGEFLAPLAVHRRDLPPEGAPAGTKPGSEPIDLDEEEGLLYTRQLGEAFALLKARAEELEAEGQARAALDTIRLCTPLSLTDSLFDPPAPDDADQHGLAMRQFQKELLATAYFLPPNLRANFADQTPVNAQLLRSVENMKVQLCLDQCLAERDAVGVFRLEGTVPEVVARDPDAVDMDILCRSMKLAEEHDFGRAMDLSIRVCQALATSSYHLHDFVLAVLAPTVYDGPCTPRHKERAGSLLEDLTRTSAEWLIANVRLQKAVLLAKLPEEVVGAVQKFDISSLVEDEAAAGYDLAPSWVEVEREPCPETFVLPQRVVRRYLESLAVERQLGRYFLAAAHLLFRARGYEFEATLRGLAEAQLKELAHRWGRLKQRADDADTERDVDHLAAVLPDFEPELRGVLDVWAALRGGCSAAMLDRKAHPLPTDPGMILAEMEALMAAMDTALNYCLNKLLLHSQTKAGAISFARSLLGVVNSIVPTTEGCSPRTTLETVLALHRR